MNIRQLVFSICGLLLIWSGQVAKADFASNRTTAFRIAFVFSGPGDTYQQTGTLNPGIPVNIVERNTIGTWVRFHRMDENDAIVQDGWVISGYLNRDADLHFGDIPINTELPDADTSTVNSQSMAKLYGLSIIPIISDEMIAIYEAGQKTGKLPNVITKVGDSLSASEQYLTPMSRDDNLLGPYDYLQDALDFYGPSMASDSITARIGLTTYAIFDPFWADKARCQSDESPLTCEYRIKKPSVAFIMFGPNDVRHMTNDDYHVQMQTLIEDTLAAGIIPVVSTFSAHPDEQFFWQSINFNLELVALSDEYHFPLINLWAAARILPDYGLDDDRIHLKPSGFMNLKYDTGHEAYYGISLHNLLCLRTLDEIRLKLGL